MKVSYGLEEIKLCFVLEAQKSWSKHEIQHFDWLILEYEHKKLTRQFYDFKACSQYFCTYMIYYQHLFKYSWLMFPLPSSACSKSETYSSVLFYVDIRHWCFVNRFSLNLEWRLVKYAFLAIILPHARIQLVWNGACNSNNIINRSHDQINQQKINKFLFTCCVLEKWITYMALWFWNTYFVQTAVMILTYRG